MLQTSKKHKAVSIMYHTEASVPPAAHPYHGAGIGVVGAGGELEAVVGAERRGRGASKLGDEVREHLVVWFGVTSAGDH